ncbi:peptidyl-prolyl cis-trans isomerase [Enterocytozoon bieneusi H348]|nr:peptidyl-prolyl cis-trans isomerase [Enterocytozoon bieneusi H348]|eukprot:XP_002650045.1 peptidyl-prolyl cis-trans isomerase [Enterocytozoon bieneusi H348]
MVNSSVFNIVNSVSQLFSMDYIMNKDVKEYYYNKDAFFDIEYRSIKDNKIETYKVVFELFWNITPITCFNFARLCEVSDGYKNTIFHRVISNFMMQGGDFTNHNGTGGYSVYGKSFPDENFIIKHNVPGLLSMANAGPHTNGSQFFITFVPTPWLNGKHTVFGKIRQQYLDQFISLFNGIKTQYPDKPIHDITIINCGLIDIMTKSEL